LLLAKRHERLGEISRVLPEGDAMKTHLFARGESAGRTAVVTILAVAAGLISVPSAASAANGRGTRAPTAGAVAQRGEDAFGREGLTALIMASAALLLVVDRRRRHQLSRAETCGRRALATAVVGAATQTVAPVPVRIAHAKSAASGSTASTRGHTDAKQRRIGEPQRTSALRAPSGKRVIGYLTVSTEPPPYEARTSSDAITAVCARAGWELVEVVRDRENGRVLDRPGLRYALERIARDKANALVIGELQRVSRSIVDLGALMAWFRDTEATLIALDPRIDTSTREGYHVATTLIALGDWERERIASRTRNGLAEVRANGQPTGRPAVSDRPELLERIWAMRAANLTLRAIADRLNAEQIPTLRGGKEWRPSSIQAALGYQRPGPRDHLPRAQKSPRP
jgi:DNA invertase Pin-like site-specific DNA recombinase